MSTKKQMTAERKLLELYQEVIRAKIAIIDEELLILRRSKNVSTIRTKNSRNRRNDK